MAPEKIAWGRVNGKFKVITKQNKQQSWVRIGSACFADTNP